MKFKNPVLRGMYPDPSMCAANGKYYLVCSSFQYFPGVPLFESDDLINWHQIGHCLTRKSQLLLPKNNTGAGIYAPTIRYNNGRFYMVVTNVSNIGNFYVWTDDIYGEWSEPVLVEQDGIDPSLFFDDDGSVYFISNGNDSDGRGYIQMSRIDIETGNKVSENEPLWYGTGGRYIEAPHMYKFNGWYYLLNAEGGTEYGHMVNYARSRSIKGPYEPFPQNPVLTNRNLGGYQLQGAGHGDIVQAADGTWWFCHLAFRQIDRYMPFHHLGRETCMESVVWKDDWFYIGTKNDGAEETVCGKDVASGYNNTQGFGKALLEVESPDSHVFAPQNFSYTKTFSSLSTKLDWCFLCNPDFSNYSLGETAFELTADKGGLTIDAEEGSPTFIGIRQCEFDEVTECDVELFAEGESGDACGVPEAGISVYMDCAHHYDVYITRRGDSFFAECRVKIGPACEVKKSVRLTSVPMTSDPAQQKSTASAKASLKIESNAYGYDFFADGIHLAHADSRYLSSEVACGFTGVFTGLYVQNPSAGRGCHGGAELSGGTNGTFSSDVKGRFTAFKVCHK